MQMYHRAVNTIRCAAICSICLSSATSAQEAPHAPSLRGDIVVSYLNRDVFLSPGQGFQNVRIGQPFNRVAKTWGRPKTTNSRFWSASRRWVYEAEDGTLLVLEGKDTIERITVKGKPSSQYQTVEGVRFGMTPREVVGLYSGPRPRGNIRHLSYPRRGIAFDFNNGKLHGIMVLAPAAP